MKMTRFGPTMAMFFTLALVAEPAEARQEQSAAELPQPATLIERHVDAIGGRDAMRQISSSRSTGRFEMPAAGVTGELEVVSARPNRSASVVRIAGFGEFRNGFDGEVGWSLDPMSGARILEGLELAAAMDQADFRAALRDPDLFDEMDTVERTEISGEECYKVRLAWKSGRESYDCYSVETGLLVVTIGSQESPMGSVEVTTHLSEYQEFGNVKMATRLVQSMLGQEQILTLEDVEFDIVEPDAFALPAEIEALLDTDSEG